MVLQQKPGGSFANEVPEAIYRMLGKKNLDREGILRAHREATIRRMVTITPDLRLPLSYFFYQNLTIPVLCCSEL